MFRTLFFTFFFLQATLCFLPAQTVAFVDVDEVLQAIPEYKHTLEEINRQIQSYQTVIDSTQYRIGAKQQTLDVERFLLTEESIEHRQKEISDMKHQLSNLQRQYFGVNGFVNQSRKEWVKPYLDRIYKAIQNYAVKNKIDIIFDTKENNNIIFANPVLDRTRDIIMIMNL